jgi:hypothetical protein
LHHLLVQTIEVLVWDCIFDDDEAVFVEASDGFF